MAWGFGQDMYIKDFGAGGDTDGKLLIFCYNRGMTEFVMRSKA